MSVADGYVTVARVGEIPEGGRKVVHVDGLPVVVFHLADGYWAMKNVCTHDGNPIDDGRLLDAGVIECKRHGAQFDVRTGAVKRFPAVSPVLTFPVRVVGDEIQVEWT